MNLPLPSTWLIPPPPRWLPWLFLAVVGLLGSILFSGLETGLYSLSRPRLEMRCWKKEPVALFLARWLRRPAGVLAGLLIWQNLCNFAVSAAVATLLHQHQVSGLAETLLSAALVLPLLLLFGEILPKDLFLTHADRWTYRLAPALRWALAAITLVPLLPLVLALDAVTRRLFHRGPEAQVGALPRLMALAEESASRGLLSDTQHDLIRRGLRLAQIKVGQVMTPWNRVIGVPANIGRAGFEALVRRYPIARLPVLGHSAQEVLGMVKAVQVLAEPGEWNLRRRLEPAMTLLDEQSVRSAIQLMQAAKRTIALVVSRDGKVIGLVTMKDLVEELLGP
jgi:CBS domain containing-hemolysin-like protein